ncbi:MAG: sugar phosphate isomerase/epimerase [Anaerolinea sp.]|nr:sugar phosphate isomerase/epimerase [Anaerolinea sp.]
MNKIGIYYAYWTREWDVDFHPFIDKVADLGFDILEINAGTIARMTSGERLQLKAHADERRLSLTTCIGLPHAYDVSSADAAKRRKGIDYLIQMAQGVGEMGGGKVSGIIYSAWPATLPPGETDKRPYLERSIASMKEAVKAAEDNNVVFNVEVVNRFEQFLLNTCAEALAYVEAVGSPNLKILLDTYHLNIEEDFIGEALIRAGDKLGHFHIGENNRMPPGYGHIPWTEIGSALRKINYTGDVVMEPFIVPGGQVGADIKVFRDLSVGLDLDEEARKALLFMRGVLK